MEKLASSQLVYNNTFDSTKNFQDYYQIKIPYYTIHNNKIVLHPRPFVNITKRHMQQNSLKNLKKKKFTGNISKTQSAQIKRKLTAWLNSIIYYNSEYKMDYQRAKYYPVFITLTLSTKQNHSDQEIKRKMLDLLIKNLKNKYQINKYFWRAETQKNGNIHFHLIVDKYVPYLVLRNMWNKIQINNGYMSEFFEKYGHRKPNSVDVKGVKDVKNFIEYVIKYCAKDEKNRKINGRVYGMSDELRNINIFTDVLDSKDSSYLESAGIQQLFNVYVKDYAVVLYFKPEFYSSQFYQYFRNKQKGYYMQLYSNLYIQKKEITKVINPVKEFIIRQPKQVELFTLLDRTDIRNSYYSLLSRSKNKEYIWENGNKYEIPIKN